MQPHLLPQLELVNPAQGDAGDPLGRNGVSWGWLHPILHGSQVLFNQEYVAIPTKEPAILILQMLKIKWSFLELQVMDVPGITLCLKMSVFLPIDPWVTCSRPTWLPRRWTNLDEPGISLTPPSTWEVTTNLHQKHRLPSSRYHLPVTMLSACLCYLWMSRGVCQQLR